MNLTPEQASKLHAANLSNIVKKVKAGKVLTAYEQKQLAAATKESDDLVPQKNICEIFSITRKTIAQWRREGKDGVPKKETGGENLKKWREFFSSNPDAGFFDGKPRSDRESLLCQKLEVEIEIAKLKKSRLDGELISMSDVNDGMAAIGAVLRAAIARLQSDLPPILEGMSASQMSKRIEEAGSSMMSQMREMLEQKMDEWQNQDD